MLRLATKTFSSFSRAARRGAAVFARALATALATVCVAMGALADGDAPVISESQIQAAFLYNFARFVEWPDGTFRAKGSPLVIGVLGDGAIGPALDVIVEGRRINGRPIIVRTVATLDDVAAAQILFVAAAQEPLFETFDTGLGGVPVLIVGESPDFASRGGAIAFVYDGGRLRFEIDLGAAEARGLKVSGELQKLATVVRRAP